MSLLDDVKKQLNELGSRSKRSLGQNFLINENVILKIIESARSSGAEFFIEVGPGLGALTAKIEIEKKNFRLIELDRVLAQQWREKGYQVDEADALKWDWSAIANKSEYCFFSNLPYQISSSLVINRSLDPVKFSKMVLMFQKEVAQRITADVGGSEYGLLSVIAQSAWSVSKVCDVGPSSFFPKPKISSRVLQFFPLERKVDPEFLPFVKACFSHRRKQLKHNVGGFFTAQEWKQTISRLGFAETVRAQELSVEQFHQLFASC